MKVKKSQDRTQNQGSEVESNQQFEESTQSALDAVCRSDTQTYEQFMANFTQLTPDDVTKKPSNVQLVGGDSDDDWQPPDLPTLGKSAKTITTDSTTIHKASNQFAVKPATSSEESTKKTEKLSTAQVLEEEVLEAGTVMEPYLVRATTKAKTPKVQLGNFVEEDDLDNEDDGENEYLPSFLKTESNKTLLTSEEVSTKAKSLPVAISKPAKKSSKAENNPPMDMLAELAAIKSGNATSVPKSTLHEDTPLPTFDLNKSSELELPSRDGCEVAAQIMAHASVKSDREQTEENILDLIGREDDQSDEEDTENDYDPALDLPNPGEIIEEKESIVKDFVTKLNFTAHVRDGMEGVSSQVEMNKTSKSASETQPTQEGESTTEAVEPFSLDADFDYDNVVLSPKYNEDEMAIIQSAMKPTAQEQASASS